MHNTLEELLHRLVDVDQAITTLMQSADLVNCGKIACLKTIRHSTEQQFLQAEYLFQAYDIKLDRSGLINDTLNEADLANEDVNDFDHVYDNDCLDTE